MNDNDLTQMRVELATQGKWNIGYFFSGLIFWIFTGIICYYLPIADSRFYMVIGTFFIFPIALLFSKILKADPFNKFNRVGNLVGYTHISIIFLSFPLIIFIAIKEPNALIFVMAVIYCLDFYVMSWSFGSRIFIFHAIIRVTLTTIIYIGFPKYIYSVIPFAIAFIYLTTIVTSQYSRKRWLDDKKSILKN